VGRAAEVAEGGVRGIVIAGRRESIVALYAMVWISQIQPDFRREEGPLTECAEMKDGGGRNILIAMEGA
jgi:hypothetical protein